MTHCRYHVCAVTEVRNPMELPQNLSTSCLGQAGKRETETGSLGVQRSDCVESPRRNLGYLGKKWWLYISSPDFLKNDRVTSFAARYNASQMNQNIPWEYFATWTAKKATSEVQVPEVWHGNILVCLGQSLFLNWKSHVLGNPSFPAKLGQLVTLLECLLECQPYLLRVPFKVWKTWGFQ